MVSERLTVEFAKQKAISLIFDEFQQVPERGLKTLDYKEIRNNWVVTFSAPDFPDLLVIVEYDASSKSVYTHIYQRRTRSSEIDRSTLDIPLFDN